MKILTTVDIFIKWRALLTGQEFHRNQTLLQIQKEKSNAWESMIKCNILSKIILEQYRIFEEDNYVFGRIKKVCHGRIKKGCLEYLDHGVRHDINWSRKNLKPFTIISLNVKL